MQPPLATWCSADDCHLSRGTGPQRSLSFLQLIVKVLVCVCV